MTRDNWKERFDRAAIELAGKAIYITIDLDCLSSDHAATNWENGLFTSDDIAWAITRLSQSSKIIAGDLCGAFSPPSFARWTQRLASRWDHPKLPTPTDARLHNHKSLSVIWPALTTSRASSRGGFTDEGSGLADRVPDSSGPLPRPSE
jgi:hypothetical protein